MLQLNFTPFPFLTTDRLVLRPLCADDAEDLFRLRSNDEVNKFLGRPPATSIEDAKRFIEKIETAVTANESIYWVIKLKDDNQLMGTICLYNISSEKELAEIGYELHPDFQGKGIMQEAISAVIQYGFEEIKLATIAALPEGGNKKSIAVLLRNHFQPDLNHAFVSKEEADDLAVFYLNAPK